MRPRVIPGLEAAKREVRASGAFTPALQRRPEQLPGERLSRPRQPEESDFLIYDEVMVRNHIQYLTENLEDQDASQERIDAAVLELVQQNRRRRAAYQAAMQQYEEDLAFYNAREELAREVSPPRDLPPVPIPPEPYERMTASERSQLLRDGLSEGEIERLEHASLLRYLRAERDYEEDLGLAGRPRTARRTVPPAAASQPSIGRTPTHVSDIPKGSVRSAVGPPGSHGPGGSGGPGGLGGPGGGGRDPRQLAETIRNTTIAKRPAGGGESDYTYQQTRILKSDYPIPMP
jgi:hypothetical protein